MGKNFVFTKSGAGRQAKELENHLAAIIKSENISRYDAMAEYQAVRKSIELPNERNTVYVITDINPLLAIARQNQYKDVKKAIDLHLPLSGEGMVVAPGIDDARFPHGYNGIVLPMNTYMPSIEATLVARGSQSGFMDLKSVKMLRVFENLYRAYRGTDFIDGARLTEKISSKGFRLKNVNVWGAGGILVDQEVVQDGVFRGSGIPELVRSIDRGDSADSAITNIAKIHFSCKASREKFDEVCRRIKAGTAGPYLLALKKECATISLQAKLDINPNESITGNATCSRIITLSQGGNKDLIDARFKKSLDFLAIAYSRHSGSRLATGMAKVLVNLICTLENEGAEGEELKSFCASIFDRSIVSGAIATADLKLVHKHLGWFELVARMNKSDKRETLSNDFGV